MTFLYTAQYPVVIIAGSNLLNEVAHSK